MNDTSNNTLVPILFVDDEENITRSLQRLFSEEDYQVYTAASAKEALSIIDKHHNIGVIISDQRMPGMTGIELLEEAQKRIPHAARILLTGYSDIHAAIDAINRGGAYRFISKPWKNEEILQIVKDAAERFKLIKENLRLNEIVKRQNRELKEWSDQLEHILQEQTIVIQHKHDELQIAVERLKTDFQNMIAAFSRLIELQDVSMINHSKNVAEISLNVTEALNLSDQDQEDIVVAALLHDIGKIGMPGLLLSKTVEKMNAEEQKVYMMHPVRGQIAIDSIEPLRKVGILIRHHHECFGGAGFPDGLKEEQIPIGARIIAVADFVEKAAKKFPGHNSAELALQELDAHLKTQFDPHLFPHIAKAAREIYKTKTVKRGTVECELLPNELREGMIVSRDVLSGTGVLLLSRGTMLNNDNIPTLNRHNKLDPSNNGIFVWVKE
ncbi:MAG TPA: response regulator [Thermodesulfobacteriota bacterium]|nr:response regulator [Deltaproteobacteria bacterium]HNR12787.1 response regulator [Thermodesulfobacteriota bacterium]HNU71858.1 response regulator [Thermodesulfobacteriota bacterium]HOC38486.1 response regulator [Thermodesulfobacteriota bacterium]HQO76935.1 response regulator [Thermodesulfobacteriota bacterium]